MAPKLHHGSCHCGSVRYEAQIDLAQGTNRCNCSLCSKARAWFTFVPADRFRLVQGEDVLSDYRWVPPGKDASFLTYRFCSKCGVRLFAMTGAPEPGRRSFAVNVPTLDDVDREALKAAPMRYFDGAHDRFDAAPEDVSLL